MIISLSTPPKWVWAVQLQLYQQYISIVRGRRGKTLGKKKNLHQRVCWCSKVYHGV